MPNNFRFNEALFKAIRKEAAHKQFTWIVNNRNYHNSRIEESLDYWIALVAHEYALNANRHTSKVDGIVR